MSTWLIVALSIAAGLSPRVVLALFLGRAIRFRESQPTADTTADAQGGSDEH
jgi:hypothetical protein